MTSSGDHTWFTELAHRRTCVTYETAVFRVTTQGTRPARVSAAFLICILADFCKQCMSVCN